MRHRASTAQLIFPLAFVVAVLVAVWPTEAQEAAPPAASEAAVSDVPPAAEESENWSTRVDQFFGDYLVNPLANVLFYDFGTGDWLFRRSRPVVRCSKEYHEITVAKYWPGDDVPETAPCPICHPEAYPPDELDGTLSGAADYDSTITIVTGTSVPLVVMWLTAGAIFFTLRMGFINVRAFRHGIELTRGRYDNPDETGEVSHFQALASALSATIGLGNIAGVAIAVGQGGPGAVFWMIVAGLIGMTSKFAECSLSQMYRKVAPDGTVSGGPMHYLREGLKEVRVGGVGLGGLGTVLATFFALICIGASFGGGCAFQVDQSLGAIRGASPTLDAHPWIYGLIMAFLVGIVIIGGIRRIAATAEKIVPLMCCVYVATAIYILLAHLTSIGPAIALIFREAFDWNSVYGGFLGVLVIGIKRAAFSNEAGIGSAAIAHAAAKTEEPIREGIVASLGPFIDTVLICTMTGLVIIITDAYHQYPELVVGDNGAAMTALAFGGVVAWFPYVLYVAMVLFAYSTMISWSYYGERCWSHLFGQRTALVYRLMFLVFVVLGSIVTAKKILEFSDLMILSMAFPNIMGVALLSGKIRRALDDYWRRYKAGEMEPKQG